MSGLIGSLTQGISQAAGMKSAPTDLLSELLGPQQSECQAPAIEIESSKDIAMLAHQELGGMGKNVCTFA